jgi:hypothetical protein
LRSALALALCAFAGTALTLTTAAHARADEGSGGRALASPVVPEAPRRPERAPSCSASSSQPEFALDVSAIAMLPLTAGARIAMEVPGHFVLHVSAGLLPVALMDGINDVGTGWSLWNETDAQVARTMLGDATWFEVGLGIRPWGTPGLEISAGYSLLWTHRPSTLETMAPSAIALAGPADASEVGIDVTIDAIHAELAWQTELLDGVSLRVALGWIHAFRHSVQIVSESRDERVISALRERSASLERELGSRAFGPTLSFALGVHLD